ncbi:PepSY-associated TM helix domain-containing protein [Halarcobacter anaerophilus]|uniref:PepSY-associated TM helix domain-containing protein n=1 Tax=Halarcobacter anaerophilus TaxID=877500 RepID=UPI0005CA344A|nr:PepSY-associated TM helix domain-containing protein [Halarcobacter anaerophilus]
MSLDNTYLKYLIKAHTIIGIFVIFFFFISTFFGTITVFKPYLNSWQNPSRHFEVLKNSNFDLDIAIPEALKELGNPQDKVKIELPSIQDRALSVNFGFSQKVYINPYTNELINIKNEDNFLTTFFNNMHINLNLSRFGQTLMGLSSVAIIFLTISGVYLWLLNRKTRVKVKNSWFKWHKDLSLVILPYILIFALTGAVLGLMLSSSSAFAYSATNGKETVMAKLVRPIIFPAQGKVEKTGEVAPMENFSTLYKKAQELYPNLNITRINLYNWNDKNAQIIFNGYLQNNRILTSRVNRASITLNAQTGALIEKKGLEETHSISKFLSGFYFFHFLFDEEILVRLIYLIFGIVFAVSLVFGLLIWIEKSRAKYKNHESYFNFISKFTLAISIGLLPSTAFLLFLYWFLPFDILQRDTWLTGAFYSFLSFTLFYAVYEKDTLKGLKNFLYASSLFLFLAVLFHEIKMKLPFWESFSKNLPEIFWLDFSLVFFALIAFLIGKNIQEIKFIEKFKGL